jgi:EAL domain-containing protein (putative c-di-GMP-specific phosphodiesterase class I)
VIEITETTVMSDFEGSKAVTERLESVGIVASIDDFGAGYTSISDLSNLAVGEVKLDRSLVTGLGARDQGRRRELVQATIDLGHAMGLRVVAEGIEDDATLDVLRGFGCDRAQGYFIGRPMPAEAFRFREGGMRSVTVSGPPSLAVGASGAH